MARCRSQCASRRNIAVHLNLLPLRLFGPGTKERERERVVYMSEPLVLHFYGIMDEEFHHLSHVAAAKKCRRQKAQIFISLTHKKKQKLFLGHWKLNQL